VAQQRISPSPPKVVLYGAPECSLCERARATLEGLRTELDFELVEVDISGDAELEQRYRELIPVVEIDGRQAFTYYVHVDAFRRRLAQARGGRTTL
jgi:glutaredoxin